MQEPEPFCPEFKGEVVRACRVAARPREAGDEAKFDLASGQELLGGLLLISGVLFRRDRRKPLLRQHRTCDEHGASEQDARRR